MKFLKIYKSTLVALGAVLLLFPTACSDDHFDLKYSSESGNKTIWENVQANPNLSQLAEILSRTKYYTSQSDTRRTMTYADLLNGSQAFTFFAPLNDTYDAQFYLDQLTEIATKQRSGDPATIEQANYDEYKIGRQFLQNHILRGFHESNTDNENDSLLLLNGKLVSYYVGDNTFNDVKVSSKTPSSNGLLHCLDGYSQFLPNIYEYVLENSSEFDSAYVAYMDTTRTFNESRSEQGAMNSEGKMVYIDSIFDITYNYLKDSRASVQNEDSFYIAVVPTNAAYTEGEAKLKSLFNYKSSYKDGYNGVENKFSDQAKAVANQDSLLNAQVKSAMLASMFFSPSIFPEQYRPLPYRKNSETILNYAQNIADSLISTNGTVFYKSSQGTNPLFVGSTYETASNGVVFPMLSYQINPANSIVKKKTIDLRSYFNGDATNTGNSTGSSNRGGQVIYLTEDTKSVSLDENGDTLRDVNGNVIYVSNHDGNINSTVDITALGDSKSYRYFELSGSMMYIYIPLSGVYSTKYKIRIQVIPNDVNIAKMWYKENKDGTRDTISQVTKFTARLLNDEGEKIGDDSEDLIVEPGKVQTLTIWDEIEIPNCYANLPDGINNSFPLLRLQVRQNGQSPRKPNSTDRYGLSIVKIFVDPVE